MSNSLMLLDKDGTPGFQFLVREMKRSDGRVVGIKSGVALVTLRESKQEWVEFKGGGHITANGYREINRASGLTVREPPSIFVEGHGHMPNPYSMVEDGVWTGGILRMVAFGRNATGQMSLADYTNRITVNSIMNEALLAVRRDRPQAVIWGVRETSPADLMEDVLLTFNDDIEDEIEEAKRRKWKSIEWKRRMMFTAPGIKRMVDRTARRVRSGRWMFRIVEPATKTGLWYDMGDAGVAKAHATMSRTDEIGIKKLRGATYRNVSRDHPANPGMMLGPEQLSGEKGQRIARVQTFFHEQVEDRADLEDLLAQFSAGVDVADVVVVRGKGEVVAADLRGDDDDDGHNEPVQAQFTEKDSRDDVPETRDERQETIAEIDRLVKELPGDVVERVLGDEDPMNLSDDDLRRVLSGLLDWAAAEGG